MPLLTTFFLPIRPTRIHKRLDSEQHTAVGVSVNDGADKTSLETGGRRNAISQGRRHSDPKTSTKILDRIKADDPSLLHASLPVDVLFNFPNAVELLTEALKTNTHVTSVSFSHLQLSDDGVDRVCDLLSQNTHLRKVDLSFNTLTDAQARKLGKAINKNGQIAELVANGCNLTEGVSSALFAELKCKQLQTVSIAQNPLCEGGTRAICQWLARTDNGVTSLNISHADGLNHRAFIALANLIKSNDKLLSLNIQNTGCTRERLELLLKALKQNSHLTDFNVTGNACTLKDRRLTEMVEKFWSDRINKNRVCDARSLNNAIAKEREVLRVDNPLETGSYDIVCN